MKHGVAVFLVVSALASGGGRRARAEGPAAAPASGPTRLYDPRQPKTPLSGRAPAAPAKLDRAAKAAGAGEYYQVDRPSSATCASWPVVASALPDDQVDRTRTKRPNGFACPNSCTNRTPVRFANGTLSFDLVWTDDAPAFDPKRGYAVAMHRTHVELPLTTRGDLPEPTDDPRIPYLGSHVILAARPPLTWTSQDGTRHRADAVRIRARLDRSENPDMGLGWFVNLSVGVQQGGDFPVGEGTPGCRADYLRTDFRPPTGDGGDDGASGTNACVRGCRDEERQCMRGCGRDQDCKLSCMSQGRACGNGC